MGCKQLIWMVLALLVLASAAHAEPYAVFGQVKIGVRETITFGDRIFSQSVSHNEGRTEMSLSIAYTDPWGDNAYSQATASLASGTLQACVYAECVDTRLGMGGGWADATAVTMKDRLTFTVPAGHYDAGVVAVLKGDISGRIEAGSRGTAWVGTAIVFGSAGVQHSWTENDASVVFFPFELQHTLVTPGSTLSTSRNYVLDTYGELTLNVNSGSQQLGSTTADFGHSLRFSSLDVPDGVTWTSSSGKFLTAVPEPSTIALLAAGAIGFLAYGWRRRKRAA